MRWRAAPPTLNLRGSKRDLLRRCWLKRKSSSGGPNRSLPYNIREPEGPETVLIFPRGPNVVVHGKAAGPRRRGASANPAVVRSLGHLNVGAIIKSLSENSEGSCGEGLWRWARRRGRRIPAAGCSGRANADHRQKDRRPEGFRTGSKYALRESGRSPITESKAVASG